MAFSVTILRVVLVPFNQNQSIAASCSHSLTPISTHSVTLNENLGSSVQFMGCHVRRMVGMPRKCLQGACCQAGSLRSFYVATLWYPTNSEHSPNAVPHELHTRTKIYDGGPIFYRSPYRRVSIPVLSSLQATAPCCLAQSNSGQ